jgi:hypothetical protein
VAQRMKDHQYSGATDESLMETVNLYTRVCADYGLSSEQKLRYFHNAFTGQAFRHYDRHLANSCVIFSEAAAAMTMEYKSATRQSKAKAQMSQLRLCKVRDDQGCCCCCAA